ncbi:MAG: hypothetical protein MJE68_03745 [Proteobacteria bacterium]|nr:hypothetical protein [Pseudomonadota bacterium]
MNTLFNPRRKAYTVTAIVWRFLSVRPSVANPLLQNGKGRYRESTAFPQLLDHRL